MNKKKVIIKRYVGERGQVVIPKDIRKMLNIKNEVVFEIKNNEVTIKQEQEVDNFLEEFFTIGRNKKNIALKDIKKLEEESYGLH